MVGLAGRLDVVMVSDMEAERVVGEKVLRLRKVMVRVGVTWGFVVLMLRVRARWSDRARSMCERESILIPVEQIKSRMCPCV